MSPDSKLVGGVFGLILLIAYFCLDTPAKIGYTDIHALQCFERHVKEPWEVEPLGRIEQVGIKRVLVTMGRDRKPVVAEDAYVYGFSMTLEEFHKEYKEVACVTKL